MPAKTIRMARGEGSAGGSLSAGPWNRQARRIETAPSPRKTDVEARPAQSSAKTIELSIAAPMPKATSQGIGNQRRQRRPSAYAQARQKAAPRRINGTVSKLVGFAEAHQLVISLVRLS